MAIWVPEVAQWPSYLILSDEGLLKDNNPTALLKSFSSGCSFFPLQRKDHTGHNSQRKQKTMDGMYRVCECAHRKFPCRNTCFSGMWECLEASAHLCLWVHVLLPYHLLSKVFFLQHQELALSQQGLPKCWKSSKQIRRFAFCLSQGYMSFSGLQTFMLVW